MKGDRLLHLAEIAMAIALALMLIGLARPTPATLGLFMGFGLPCAFLAVAVFAIRVLRDLRML